MDVAYLGPEHTYTHKAAQSLFSEGNFVELPSIRSVIRSVDERQCEYGVIPLENIYNGSVVHTFDSLQRSTRVKVVGEKSFQIVHCLGALPGHDAISIIYSKDQAIDQCEPYLCTYYPDALTSSVESTGRAAIKIAEEGLLHAAAIASKDALIENGLEVLAEDICPHNKTRFVMLGTRWNSSTGDDKTILSLHPLVRDKPGVLARCLNIFEAHEINLEGISSRPDGARGYYFYVELNGHISDLNVGLAIDSLQYILDKNHQNSDTVKVLGSFPNSHWKDED